MDTKIQDLRERCFYLLTLLKAKNMALFEKYTAELAKITAEESTQFYYYLLAEYKKLLEGTNIQQIQKAVTKSEVPKPAQPTKPAKKAAKKAAKKVVKKPVKKAMPKKKAKKKARRT